MLVSKYPHTHALRRPLIYVYDLPPEYVTRMLQYKIDRRACVYRFWDERNNLVTQSSNLYGVETYLHEMLLQSEHRCGYCLPRCEAHLIISFVSLSLLPLPPPCSQDV